MLPIVDGDGRRYVVLAHTYMQEGRTALISTVEVDAANCVRLLSDFGADMEAKDNVRGRGISMYHALYSKCMTNVSKHLWLSF